MQPVVARGLLPPRPALTLISGNMLRSCKRILGDTPVGAAKCCFRKASPEFPRTLLQLLTLGCLTRQQKGLDQRTLSANGHPGESLVPLALGYLWLAVKPLCQQF